MPHLEAHAKLQRRNDECVRHSPSLLIGDSVNRRRAAAAAAPRSLACTRKAVSPELKTYSGYGKVVSREQKGAKGLFLPGCSRCCGYSRRPAPTAHAAPAESGMAGAEGLELSLKQKLRGSVLSISCWVGSCSLQKGNRIILNPLQKVKAHCGMVSLILISGASQGLDCLPFSAKRQN
jgi:hypothetical protein